MTRALTRWLGRLAVVVAITVAVLAAASFGIYASWNDHSLARTVSRWISSNLAGGGGPQGMAFSFGRVHYEWLPAVRSFFLGGAMPFEAWDIAIHDPHGAEVIFVPHLRGRFYVGWVAWAQIRALIPGQGVHTEVHLEEVHVDSARAHIEQKPGAKANLVAAFAARTHGRSDPRSGMVITADRCVLDKVEYAMDFPGWHAALPAAHIELSSLRYSSFAHEQQPERPAFVFHVAAVRSRGGTLRLGDAWEFPIEELDTTYFGARDPDCQHLGFAAQARTRGAPTRLQGRLTDAFSDHPGVELAIDFESGAGLVGMLPARGLLGGDPRGHVDVHGPFSHVLVDGHGEGLRLNLAGVVAERVGGRFAIDDGKLSVTDMTSDLGDGHVGGGIDIDFSSLEWRADLEMKDVDPGRLGPLVPPEARTVLAGRLDGRASAAGSLAVNPERVAVSGIGARLRRRGAGPLPRVIGLRGGARFAPARIQLDDLELAGDGLTATFRGTVDPTAGTMHTRLRLSGQGLGPLLDRFGVPRVARGLIASAEVHGSFRQPTIDATFRATHVGLGDRRVPQLDGRLRFAAGRLDVSELLALGFGGRVAGKASVGLFDGPFSRPIREPPIAAEVQAEHLRFEQLLGLPALVGELSGRFDIGGTLAHPTGSAALDLPRLAIAGDPYHGGVFQAAIDDQGLDIQRISLERDGGGRFTGRGRVGWDGSLDVDVQPRAFPVQAIPALRDSPVPLSGILSGLVHIGGALGGWIPSGVIEAGAIRVREFLFGDGRIELRPEKGRIRVSALFQPSARRGRSARARRYELGVEGWITLTPSVAGDLTVRFVELPLDELVPEVKQLAEVQSMATGTAHISFDLNRNAAAIELRLSKLLLSFAGAADSDDSEEAAAEEFSNPPGEDVVLRWDGRQLRFDSFRLVDERAGIDGRARVGELRITGHLGPESDAHVEGRVELRFLEFLAGRAFDHIHGVALANVRVLGPMSRPHLHGWLDVQRASVTLRGANRPFSVVGGRIDFRGGQLALSGLKARLDDSVVEAGGSVTFDENWRPGNVSLDVAGAVPAVLLEWLLPDRIAETRGGFALRLEARGTWAVPRFRGRIEAVDLAFREKKLSRDVLVRSGTAILDGRDVAIGCPDSGGDPPTDCRRFAARIDDASDVYLDGRFSYEGALLSPRLSALSVHGGGNNVEWGSPGVFSLTLTPDLRLELVREGDDRSLRLSGSVNVVTGRYYENFDINNLLNPFVRPRTVEVELPFYAGVPLLEEMELDVELASSGALFIRNNIADLHVSLPSLAISGTLAEPEIEGTVFVEAGGRFTIPLLRGEFVSEPGSITFEADKEFPARTPRLDIKAATDWQDRYDQIHHINLVLRGTYHEPELDLSSTDGWDKNQVLAAMLTGGSPDQLRRAITEPARRGGTTISDGLPKSLSGLFLGRIEDPLKQAIGFDLVRLELGYDSVLIRLCWVKKANYQICGSGDVGFATTSRYDARIDYKLTDHVWVGLAGERIEHGIDTTEDIVNRIKLQLSLRYPIF